MSLVASHRYRSKILLLIGIETGRDRRGPDEHVAAVRRKRCNSISALLRNRARGTRIKGRIVSHRNAAEAGVPAIADRHSAYFE